MQTTVERQIGNNFKMIKHLLCICECMYFFSLYISNG